MNFLDTFDITTSPDHNPTSSSRTTAAAESPSLNEEVNQVVGQLSRFWGGFVRQVHKFAAFSKLIWAQAALQSQTAIESARKDFGDAVVQAQKELNRFTGETTTEQPIENEKVSLLTASEASITGEASTNKTDVDREALLPETSIEGTQSSVEDTTTPYQSFFSRLQASLPPSIVSSVQRNLPTSIDMDSLNLIRDTWTSELQRVQGVTLAQAEEYVHRSEAILRDTIREASEVLKDAVRVLPPEGYSPAGAVWDGTDVWMFSDIHYDEPGKGKARAVDGLSDDSKTLRDVQRSAATRAEAMLKQLRHDPEVIKRDPEADDGAAFKEWLSTAGWPMDDKITKALSDPADGSALQLTHDSLGEWGCFDCVPFLTQPQSLPRFQAIYFGNGTFSECIK